MEEECSVNSPRRVLSFSERRRAKAGFHDSDSRRSSGFGVSGEHGPKPSEVYGFVGCISTVVATVIFLVWAYVPESVLESVGIHYYPSQYWAIALPTYLMVTVVLMLVFYIGLNFMSTPSPSSLNTLFDEYCREPGDFVPETEEEEQDRPIEPISDLDITKINHLMFNSCHAN
ncbi:PREDICTED: phosphatidylinositol N-acetylglucosaminyltransferase subunit P-like isoform X2 [Tarenaya hassleriana]|nr:PREDICTED: phosphatidylinositol N-acetylglucosaminyltransferase subunit P-like isoform X2 [Tarenaya hassleriana]XP_010534470.1 PREDICTED: phosphatidylinositol N-acetylglucosaminyltransferase subunit P-like isoform X2 [Tarenaya hassleriana]XP_019057726.1 PREDICTED: phosphatidylinositol N-acetylglucosaminyltransferase subunit P-like isoform X2 [Tarenaya hassleriana]